MKFTKDSALGMVAALGIICVVSAALLGWVNSITAGPIEKARLAKQTEAIAAVLPPFANNPAADAVEIYADGDNTGLVTLFPARDGQGRLTGAAVATWTLAGFSGRFDLIVGFDAKGAITGYEVMQHSETPGLGAKMDTWFKSGDPNDRRNVIGRRTAAGAPEAPSPSVTADAATGATAHHSEENPDVAQGTRRAETADAWTGATAGSPAPGPGALTVSKDGGEVDGITAATITSRAFLDAVNRASRAFSKYISSHPTTSSRQP